LWNHQWIHGNKINERIYGYEESITWESLNRIETERGEKEKLQENE
jgi:hypothetical protein